MYFIPLAVIVMLYLMILQKLWKQSVPGGTRSVESVRGRRRVTKMVVIVIVTFIICWLPIQVIIETDQIKNRILVFKMLLPTWALALSYQHSKRTLGELEGKSPRGFLSA